MQAAIPFPDIGPEIFSVTLFGMDFALRWYAMAYVVGIFIGFLLARRALKTPRLWAGNTAPMTPQQLEDYLFWLVLGIVIGGRLAFVAIYQPAYYMANPAEIPMLWQGGMAFHGGFLGVGLATWIWCSRNGVSIGSAADVIGMATPPAILLGRAANFINNELWGRPTDMPWGVIFPGPAAQDCPGVEGPCARHPSQLYEAGLEGLVLGLILIVAAWRFGALKVRWLVTGMFIAGYGLSRFVVEFFRLADAQFITPDNPWGHVVRLTDTIGLTMGQLLSLPMVAVGLAVIAFALSRRPRAAAGRARDA